MKITSLLEAMVTPSSDPVSNQSQQAPRFGRNPHVLEDDEEENLEETTTSGAIATVAAPMGGMQKRGGGSIFSGIKTSKKFPNSKAVKEGVAEARPEPEQDQMDANLKAAKERERGSERELGRDPKRSGKWYLLINGSAYRKNGEVVMFDSAAEAHIAGERIQKFRLSKGWKRADMKPIEAILEASNIVSVTEEELSEEQILAKELKKQLELFKKAKNNELANKPADQDLGNKPKDKELQRK